MKPINDFFTLLEWRTTNELNAVRDRNRAIIMGITVLTIITIVCAIFVYILLKRKIISPLSVLEVGAKSIEGGDYSQYIDIATKDEIGSLSEAFNAMNRSIEERTARLRSVIDTAVDAIIVITDKGIVQEFSPAAERIFGYRTGEVIGNNVSMLMPEPTKSNHDGYLNRYLNTRDKKILGISREEIARKKNGDTFPIDLSVSKARIGGEIYFTGILRDITERNRAEKELLRLSRAVEFSPASVIVTDLDGNIEYVNPKFCDLTGYSVEEVVGRNPRLLKSGENPPEVYRDLWKTISKGKEWRGEFLNKKKNGELYWEAASISPILDAKGEIINYVGVQEDITQQKEMQHELQEALHKFKESEEKFKNMTTAANSAIVMIDNKGNIEFWNKAAQKIFGWAENEVKGKDFHRLIAPLKYHEQFKKAFRIFRKTGKGKVVGNTIELTALRKSGEEFPVDISLSAIHLKGSWQAIGIINDITERKRTEEEIERNLEELREFNQLAVGRELMMIQLKEEINDLLVQSGNTKKYEIV